MVDNDHLGHTGNFPGQEHIAPTHVLATDLVALIGVTTDLGPQPVGNLEGDLFAQAGEARDLGQLDEPGDHLVLGYDQARPVGAISSENIPLKNE